MMSSTQPVGVALVGVGGHAITHLNALQHLQSQGLVHLHAVVEASPEPNAKQLDGLRQAGVTVEPDLSTLLDNHQGKVSLVGVPVGIPSHATVTARALRAGYHVVLEKPPVGCISDFEPMLRAAKQSQRACAVHFQWIWMSSLRAVKAAIVAGKIGRLKEVRVKGRWFRPDVYYSRNRWAGRLRVDGAWVLDGTINNPFAHQVHNALFLAGPSEHAWATPAQVRAELYHARPAIFGDDTTCLAVRTDTGVDLRLWFTLCSEQPVRHPTILAIGEAGRITWPLADNTGRIDYADGRTETIPADDTSGSIAVYANVCRYLQGQDKRILCTLADTRPFVQTVSAAYEIAGPPHSVAGRFVARVGEPDKPGFAIKGIDEAIDKGFEAGQLFSEMGLGWAHEARSMAVGPDYNRFRPKWAD
jgi:predicted dehydrogenase